MSKFFHFTDPIFRGYFIVVTGEPKDAINTLIKKGLENDPVELEQMIYHARGGSMFDLEQDSGATGHCLWIRDEKDMMTIDHECFHAVSHRMDHIGLTHGPQTEEVYAYYKTWLTDKVISELAKFKKSKKTNKRRS